MASGVIFLVSIILAAILLFVASLLATIGSVNAYDSIWYNTVPAIRSAHQYLTISAAMGWASFTVLVVILIVAACTGNFVSHADLSGYKESDGISESDRHELQEVHDTIKGGSSTHIIILVVMMLLILSTITFNVLELVATLNLSGVTTKDNYAKSAETFALTACVLTFVGLIFFVVAMIAYYRIYRKNNLHRKEIATVIEGPAEIENYEME